LSLIVRNCMWLMVFSSNASPPCGRCGLVSIGRNGYFSRYLCASCLARSGGWTARFRWRGSRIRAPASECLASDSPPRAKTHRYYTPLCTIELGT
jgi:hypothetical protein